MTIKDDDELNKIKFTKVTTTDILTLITSALVEGNDFYLKRLENNEIIFVVGKMIDDDEWIGNIINAHLELVD